MRKYRTLVAVAALAAVALLVPATAQAGGPAKGGQSVSQNGFSWNG